MNQPPRHSAGAMCRRTAIRVFAAGLALLAPAVADAQTRSPLSSGRATTLRGMGQHALPGGAPYDSLQRRLNLPGSRANPPVRGTDLDDPPCPPARPACIPTLQR